MKTFTQHTLSIVSLAAFLCALSASGKILISEDFSYPDGPLQGQGDWGRGPSSPASDNPSDHIAVLNGAVHFDWTTTESINNLLRNLWDSSDNVSEGRIYAIFDFKALEAPQAASNVRPGFFSFANSDGSQQRGFIGVQAGAVADTFQLGISPSSQLGGNFQFFSQDLALNTSYRVMLGFDAGTQETLLWVGSTDPESSASLAASSSGSNSGIRRANLRMFNSDGEGGTTDLGKFEIDNLIVTTIPEPGTYAAFIGLLVLGLVVRRRMRRS